MDQPTSVIAPKTGILGRAENWRSDLLADFLVFLIALSLCLGIATAYGFPTMAGIISAIIGWRLMPNCRPGQSPTLSDHHLAARRKIAG